MTREQDWRIHEYMGNDLTGWEWRWADDESDRRISKQTVPGFWKYDVMGPGQPAKECDDEELIIEFESACRGGDREFAPEYRDEILRRLSDNERLRRALGRIGFFCAGTEFHRVSDFVLKVKNGEQI